MIRDIVTFIDGAVHTEGVGDAALLLAGQFQAHLAVVGLPRDAGHAMHLANAPARALADAVQKAQGAAERAGQAIEQKGIANGLSCLHQTFDVPAADYPELVTRVARRFDCAVLSLPGTDTHTEDEAIFEAVLLNSGRPALGVPRRVAAPQKFGRILVAWDGGRESARAVGDAMPLLERAEYVDVARIGDAAKSIDDELPGCHIAGHLARHGISCEFRRLTGRNSVANLLLGHAAEMAADLIVMGAYRHSRWRQAVLGGATTDIMRETKIPLLMSR